MQHEFRLLSGRRRIPAGVRREVIARDGMTCRWCQCTVTPGRRGEPYRPDLLHIDHVLHWAAGGEHHPDNLVVSCADCNLRRSKPARVLRTARVTAVSRGNGHYWIKAYRPPLVATATYRSGRLRALAKFAAQYDLTIAETLRAIDRGDLAATDGAGSIFVEVPDDVWEVEEERRQERRARRSKAASVARRAQGRRDRDDLDPERVAYWDELINARREREKSTHAEH